MAPGLYVHVPFCVSRCTYCDFYRVDYRAAVADAYLEALEVEVRHLPRGMVPRTIYVGGGTPSALSDRQLERLLGILRPLRNRDQEFTFEMNPESATLRKVRCLSLSGVSRVSLGIQSLSPASLSVLGRPHGVDEALAACRVVKEWIPDLSLDLMFAIPGQSLEEWAEGLDRAVELSPEHLSLYSLTYEPASELSRSVRHGRLMPAGEDLEREMFLHAMRVLATRGYEHYEVSSFCLPGHRSRHNEAYWGQEDYIGLGPGAWSTLGQCRRVNLPDLTAYVSGLVGAGVPPGREEQLTASDRRNEYVLLGLRTSRGISLNKVRELWGEEIRPSTTEMLLREGVAILEGDNLKLTPTGFCVADRIILELMA